MRIAIYTNDLTQENQHLMPWRMVLEIGKATRAAGHQTTILAGRRHPTADIWDYDGCPVEEIAKPYSNGAADGLQQIIGRERPDVLFWPVAWCGGRRYKDLAGRTSIPIVWYVPGACYLLPQAVRAIPGLGLRSALPFLVQSVYPKRRLVKNIRGPGRGLMITASEFNRSAACKAGWPAEDVFVVPPGRPTNGPPVNGDEPTVFIAVHQKLSGRPFYLFLGPPTEIRGTDQLLLAFDLLARNRPDVCLVCLFRSDLGVDVEGIRRKIEGKSCAERIICVWESVTGDDLEAFLETCHAVVLPFLLVPSEIPLAVIEAAGHHKPVITTGPGGTAGFVQRFGLTVPFGHGKALAGAMLQLLDDQRLYAAKCDAARWVYAAHPTWEEVARSWLSIARKAIDQKARAS